MRISQPIQVGQAFNPYRQFNGVFVPEAILGTRAISPAAKLLYGQLSRRAGQDGNAYPSYGSLARDLGFSDRHVKKIAKELSDARLIEIRARADEHGRQRSNAFVFLWHEAFEPKPPAADPGGEQIGEDELPAMGENERSLTPEDEVSFTPLRESHQENLKEDKQQATVGVTDSSAQPEQLPAAATDFRKTLQGLQSRGFPSTQLGAKWEREAKASGFTDDQLAEVITSPDFDPNGARSPVPLVLRAADLLRAHGAANAPFGPTLDSVRVALTQARNGMDEGRERLERYARCSDGEIASAALHALRRVEYRQA